MDWIEKGWGKPRLKVTGDLKYRSAASNFEGLESKPLAVESFVTKPSVPRNISVTEVSVGKILVQWEESSSGTPFEYKVYAQSTGQTFLKKSTIKVSNRFRATINSLTPGVTYRIYVFAINEAGSSELPSPSSITLSTSSSSSSQTGYTPPSAIEIAAAANAATAAAIASQDPASQAPASVAPASVAASQAPASQAPASQAPASQAPASQAPASQAPASQAPASQAPASVAPASVAPASVAASQAPASVAASQAPASVAPVSLEAPTDLKVTAHDKKLIISFSPNPRAAAYQYTINNWSTFSTSTTSPIIIQDLINNIVYTIKIRSTDSINTILNPSTSIEGTPTNPNECLNPPSTPSNITAVLNGENIVVSWNIVVSSATCPIIHYTLIPYMNSKRLDTLITTSTSVTFGKVATASYTFKVASVTSTFTSELSSATNPISIVQGPPANQPSFVAVGANGNTGISKERIMFLQPYLELNSSQIALGCGPITNLISLSYDGTNWIDATAANDLYNLQTFRLFDVAWNGFSWCAAGNEGVLTSSNGLDWRMPNTPGYIGGYQPKIFWINSQWYITNIRTSTPDKRDCICSIDGVNWAESSLNFEGNLYKIISAGSYWLAHTSKGFLKSTDFITWNKVSEIIASAVAWNGSIWCAVGSNVSTSIDGSNWITASNNPFKETGREIAWNGSYWCAGGDDSIFKSDDGLNWSSRLTEHFLGGYVKGISWNSNKSIWCANGVSIPKKRLEDETEFSPRRNTYYVTKTTETKNKITTVISTDGTSWNLTAPDPFIRSRSYKLFASDPRSIPQVCITGTADAVASSSP